MCISNERLTTVCVLNEWMNENFIYGVYVFSYKLMGDTVK